MHSAPVKERLGHALIVGDQNGKSRDCGGEPSGVASGEAHGWRTPEVFEIRLGQTLGRVTIVAMKTDAAIIACSITPP